VAPIRLDSFGETPGEETRFGLPRAESIHLLFSVSAGGTRRWRTGELKTSGTWSQLLTEDWGTFDDSSARQAG